MGALDCTPHWQLTAVKVQAVEEAAPRAPAEAEGWEAHSAWNDVDGWADEVEPDLEADLEAALPSTPLAGAAQVPTFSLQCRVWLPQLWMPAAAAGLTQIGSCAQALPGQQLLAHPAQRRRLLPLLLLHHRSTQVCRTTARIDSSGCQHLPCVDGSQAARKSCGAELALLQMKHA